MIRFETISVTETRVTLDGKHVGTINLVPDGYQYVPNSSVRHAGDVFPTLRDCKQSLLDV